MPARNVPERPGANARALSPKPGAPDFSVVVPGEVLARTDSKTGLKTIIVIDGIAPGPALGDCSFVAHRDGASALRLALEGARSTTRRAVLADLPFGGGHAVLIAPEQTAHRAKLFESLRESVRLAQGRFLAMDDDQFTAADLRATGGTPPIRGQAPSYGNCRVDPRSAAALGVFLAIESALRRGRISVREAVVAVHGLGPIGFALCERLHAAGARLVVSDANSARARSASRLFDAWVVDEQDIFTTPCDVLVPCAVAAARFIEPSTRISAPLVCGTAADALFDVIDERGLLWLPDDLVASGSLIAGAMKLLQFGDDSDPVKMIKRIAQRVEEFLERRDGRSSKEVIDAWICEKLAARPCWTGWTTIMR